MRPKQLLTTFLIALSLPLAASTASAQELSVRFGNGRVSASYDSGYVRSRSYRAPRRAWVPGHYENVSRQIWIAGGYEKVWCEPVYEFRYDECGNRVKVLVRAGYWDKVHKPGHYETRYDRVWKPGYWKTSYAYSYGSDRRRIGRRRY